MEGKQVDVSAMKPKEIKKQPVKKEGTKTFEIKLTTQQLWSQLHLYAFVVFEWNPANAKRWYQDWKRRVNTSYGCTGCGSHWSQITAKHPPNFASRDDFFRWTFDRHNDVNVHTGKPLFDFDVALQLYRPY